MIYTRNTAEQQGGTRNMANIADTHMRILTDGAAGIILADEKS
jgi:hypothetical protein